MATVLIAPLGESPVVVTAMVEALEHHPDGPHARIEVVEVLYPSGQDSQLINFGFELIKDALKGCHEVREHALSFPDANTEERCIEYLQTLDAVLEGHTQDDVYVSVAGGRKSMAALTAVITQFHPQVRGLYHILDRYEADQTRRNLWTNEELINLSETERRTKLLPPVEHLRLVELPFLPLARAADLRQYLARGTADESFAIEIDDDGRAFFERVFGAQSSGKRLELRFSSTAFERFREMDDNTAERFWNCFRNMAEPATLKANFHLTYRTDERTYHFYKTGRTAERPFFYTEPNDIVGWPGRPVNRVVVAALSRHKSDERYDVEGEGWIRRGPLDSNYTLDDLPPRPGILLVPLGESPMVATQTCVLLRDREHIQIERVVLFYPGADPCIRNGARLVRELFEDHKLDGMHGSNPVSVEEEPIQGMADVDSREACERYGQALGNTIRRLREQHPDRPLHLSLSGGRKAMAALTYFGAQHAGLSRVWHTTISDTELDRRIEAETSLDTIDGLKRSDKATRLFLQTYAAEHDKFTVFRVPVIPWNVARPEER